MNVPDVDTDSLRPLIETFFRHSGDKILRIESEYDYSLGSPVFTRGGKYTTRGWTEWTEGFVYGSMLLQFEASRDPAFLELARKRILDKMALHVSHFGVHDHGFNNVSTYGNLLRMMNEGIIPEDNWERAFYSMAIRQSASVQAMRWTGLKDGGFIYSFNGPHSLFIDTIRTCRILMLAHKLGHYILGENDARIDPLQRAVQHILTSARYSVYYGEGRDIYDRRGRVAHESIFNVTDGSYRCPGTQQGYSGFTTWTRGLAWAILGFSEQLEFLDSLSPEELHNAGGKDEIINATLKAARATADYYLENTPLDGIPYWDTGAPGLAGMGNYLERNADPFNEFEPVDSSAAAIAAQGFLRLGSTLKNRGDKQAQRYFKAGLGITASLFQDPYLSTSAQHQGILLHSVYHRPGGWDHIPEGCSVPCGESSMWGDYHARELALHIDRMIRQEPYYTFFN